MAGVPSVFVRLAGCPLRCEWCDTAYAWSENSGTRYTVEQIQQALSQYPEGHVVITGGEPLTDMDMRPRPGLQDLVQALRSRAKHITIETAGLAFVGALGCDLMSISPKLDVFRAPDPEAALAYAGSLHELIDAYDYQLKFVMEEPSDIATVQHVLQSLDLASPDKVMLMPQARTRQELLENLSWVTDLCLRHGYALGQRLHLLLWDGERGR